MNEYKNFSKQDLKDREGALIDELFDIAKQEEKLWAEIKRIDKLLE